MFSMLLNRHSLDANLDCSIIIYRICVIISSDKNELFGYESSFSEHLELKVAQNVRHK